MKRLVLAVGIVTALLLLLSCVACQINPAQSSSTFAATRIPVGTVSTAAHSGPFAPPVTTSTATAQILPTTTTTVTLPQTTVTAPVTTGTAPVTTVTVPIPTTSPVTTFSVSLTTTAFPATSPTVTTTVWTTTAIQIGETDDEFGWGPLIPMVTAQSQSN